MLKVLKSLDMFGAPVPNLNIRGRGEVKTVCGACTSLVIFALTLLFGIIKMEHLALRKNPIITTNTSPLEADERFDTGSDDFMMAFAVSDEKGVPKNDTRYFRWKVAFKNYVNGEKNKTEEFLQPCSQDAMNKFYPAESSQTANEVKSQQAAGNLYCL